MKSPTLVAKDAAKSVIEMVGARALDFRTYMESADKDTVLSDMSDAWLLGRTYAKVYSGAGKNILRRGPKIRSDLNQYPWLLQLADLRSLFRAVSGRKGAYRKALLKVIETTATSAIDYVMEVLNRPDRVVYFQSSAIGLSEVLRAMDLVPFMDMAPPIVSSLLNPGSMEKYLDFAENVGVPSDACSLARSAQGILLKGESPKAAVMVGNNNCEGQINSSLLYSKKLNVPTFIMDAPNKFKSERAEEWYGKDVMRLIEWLEENTPGRMDWDLLRNILEERNRAVEAETELWEMMRLRPAPLASEAVWLSHLIGVTLLGGLKETTAMFEYLAKCAKENAEKGLAAAPDERFRAVIWHPPMGVHWQVYRYLEIKWGVSVVQDSMAYNDLGFVDTSSRESMVRGVGKLMMNTPMVSTARGPAEYYLDPLFHVIEYWGVDLILVGDHIGCKSVAAMNGILRDKCREKGIPVACVPYDLMDTRFASKGDVLNGFDQFMETVMNAEPLREEVPGI